MKKTTMLKKNYEFRIVLTRGKCFKEKEIEIFVTKNNKKRNFLGIAISTKNGNNYLTADGNKVAILNSMPIHTPEKVYNYLITNHIGKENLIKKLLQKQCCQKQKDYLRQQKVFL